MSTAREARAAAGGDRQSLDVGALDVVCVGSDEAAMDKVLPALRAQFTADQTWPALSSSRQAFRQLRGRTGSGRAQGPRW